jgi:hypothetical protein
VLPGDALRAIFHSRFSNAYNSTRIAKFGAKQRAIEERKTTLTDTLRLFDEQELQHRLKLESLTNRQARQARAPLLEVLDRLQVLFGNVRRIVAVHT